MAGSCEFFDELSGSGATDLVIEITYRPSNRRTSDRCHSKQMDKECVDLYLHSPTDLYL
jgi:hypothetical protein